MKKQGGELASYDVCSVGSPNSELRAMVVDLYQSCVATYVDLYQSCMCGYYVCRFVPILCGVAFSTLSHFNDTHIIVQVVHFGFVSSFLLTRKSQILPPPTYTNNREDDHHR